MSELDRHRFLATGLAGLAGLGSLILVGGMPRLLGAAEAAGEAPGPVAGGAADFAFAQLSDIHLGFNAAKVNPEAERMLARAVAAINALDPQPDFVIVTGDLTHTIDDAHERLDRLKRVRDQLAQLRTPLLRVMPGEHDAGLDQGDAFRQVFGPTRFSFDHKGAHGVALDNVTDPEGMLGAEQLAWLKADLAAVPPGRRILIFAHRPLFELARAWDWYTGDGQAAIDLLLPYRDVTVFYGHIHQEHHASTGHIEHHAVRSPMFALPAPGSTPKKSPLPWDPAAPFHGLGWREVAGAPGGGAWQRHEKLLAGG